MPVFYLCRSSRAISGAIMTLKTEGICFRSAHNSAPRVRFWDDLFVGEHASQTGNSETHSSGKHPQSHVVGGFEPLTPNYERLTTVLPNSFLVVLHRSSNLRQKEIPDIVPNKMPAVCGPPVLSLGRASGKIFCICPKSGPTWQIVPRSVAPPAGRACHVRSTSVRY